MFDEAIVNGLNSCSSCTGIEGVEISNEELEALKEAVLPVQPVVADPQNVPLPPPPVAPVNPISEASPMPIQEPLDQEFINEIEVYLVECKENGELTIDMSDTLIQDQGAKMVATVAAFCENLQELSLRQCGITDEGATAIFKELRNH